MCIRDRPKARRGMALTSLNKRTYDFRRSRIYMHTESKSLLTLFSLMTLEEWPSVVRGTMEQSMWSWLFFIPFIMLTSFVLLNLVAVLVDQSCPFWPFPFPFQNWSFWPFTVLTVCCFAVYRFDRFTITVSLFCIEPFDFHWPFCRFVCFCFAVLPFRFAVLPFPFCCFCNCLLYTSDAADE